MATHLKLVCTTRPFPLLFVILLKFPCLFEVWEALNQFTLLLFSYNSMKNHPVIFIKFYQKGQKLPYKYFMYYKFVVTAWTCQI